MVEAVRPRPARHWHAGNERLPGAGTSQDRPGLASPAGGGAVRIGRAQQRRAVHRTGRGRLSPEAVPEGVAERAGQRVPREEAATGPGAVLHQEAARGAGEVGAPAAQHPAEAHCRAVEAGRRAHRRQLCRGQRALRRYRRFLAADSQHPSHRAGQSAERRVLGIRPPGREVRGREDQDHGRRIHGGRRPADSQHRSRMGGG